MAPPIHVKVIAGLLNTVLTIAGVRNIVAPGTPVPVIPEDDKFQAHFHGDGDPKMAWVFQLLGVCFLMVASVKFIVVFGQVEGTFLRQKLFFALGACDLVVAALTFRYSGLPQSVIGGFAILHGLEGTAFLADASLRARPVKASGKKR